MRTDLFDFELPAASIALRPASPRDSARMLVVQPDGRCATASLPSFRIGWSPATSWSSTTPR